MLGKIYGLHESGKYHDTRKAYQQMYHIYSIKEKFPIEPEKIIVEDSNSVYEFFKNISAEKICIVADGAAIGPEMNRLYKETLKKKNIHLYLPESFEWLILSSGLISDKDIKTILEEPENYIDSTEYFSWERFFTNEDSNLVVSHKMLIDKKTKDIIDNI